MSNRKNKIILIFLTVLLLACSGCGKKSCDDVGQAGDAHFAAVETEDFRSKKNSGDLPKDSKNVLTEETDDFLEKMTLEEKVAQLFIVLPEDIVEDVDCVTEAGESTREAIERIPVGGFVYLSSNLKTEEQVKTMLGNVQAYSIDRIGLPAFLCIDEEGGTVARLSGTGKFDIPVIEDMAEVGLSQDFERAGEIGRSMGEYLSEFGFNVDFAPVADVLTNPDNAVVKLRSFGEDPQIVSEMSLQVMAGLKEYGVYATYKHFPGHGMTAGDTHEGYAYSEKTLEEIKACELIPFQKGIDAGVSFIMAGHISLPAITGDHTPASLSEAIITDLLRRQLGYDGIVITDAMNMGAIVRQYSSADAAVKSLQAGADLILMPADFEEAYEGVINAVENGVLSEERIDESLRRILYVKQKMY